MHCRELLDAVVDLRVLSNVVAHNPRANSVTREAATRLARRVDALVRHRGVAGGTCRPQPTPTGAS